MPNSYDGRWDFKDGQIAQDQIELDGYTPEIVEGDAFIIQKAEDEGDKHKYRVQHVNLDENNELVELKEDVEFYQDSDGNAYNIVNFDDNVFFRVMKIKSGVGPQRLETYAASINPDISLQDVNSDVDAFVEQIGTTNFSQIWFCIEAPVPLNFF